MKPEILKLLEEKLGGALNDIDIEMDFLASSPFVKVLRPIIGLK